MGNPVIRKRTIQHPGFEFFETDMSIYKEYVQNNDALVVGFFSRGPIMTPVSIKNLNDYSVYFGTPESEAEIYFYKGIEAVLDAGGTVTALRLPYDNTTCGISKSDGIVPQYRVLTCEFDDCPVDPLDIKSAYEGGTQFKTIKFTPSIVNQEYITTVVGGLAKEDFVIINKYNDIVTDRGEEIFVTVLGAGNAIRTQGLNEGKAETEIKLMKDLVISDLVNEYTGEHEDPLYDLFDFGAIVSRERIKWESNGELDKHGEMLTVANSYPESLPVWFPQISTYTVSVKENDTYVDKTYIDPRKDDFITVVVSKIKPSTLEAGKFNIVTLETFSGSIFKGSIDQVSNESNYIGDIINTSSNFISFYGKTNYEKYNKEEDTILVVDQEPWRFSWKDGAAKTITVNVDEHTGIESITASEDKISLKKVILDPAKDIEYVTDILRPALKKVANNIKFLYRDAYDFGLSSVITFRDANTGVYQPTKTENITGSDPSAIKSSAWKKVVLEFARHCQFKHKLSMFHADSPRKLVLNGNLSFADDLYQDQDTVIFTPKKIQTISIKDNTYMSQNAQWYEVADEFNKTMMWIPNSIRLAGDITFNDINGNVWDAPAGHRYGLVKNTVRVAFNPEPEIQDRLYSNCINYAVTWPDGVTTIEGQKTAYSEISTLNRVNARRLLIWLERWSQMVSADFIYEPNTSDVREKFVAALEEEFKRCFTLGGLYGYRIVCDDTNNSAEVIDRNELRVAIMVQISKTIEFVLANFIITKTGVNLEEISPVF